VKSEGVRDAFFVSSWIISDQGANDNASGFVTILEGCANAGRPHSLMENYSRRCANVIASFFFSSYAGNEGPLRC